MKVCPVLPPHVSALLLPLRALIGGMDARETLPPIARKAQAVFR